MSQPTDELPAEVWNQDGPNQGAVGGRVPRVACPVIVEGVVATRETSPLAGNAIFIPNVSQNFIGQLCGAAPQRRSLIVCTDVDILINSDKGILTTAQWGFYIPAKVPVVFSASEDIWFLVLGAGPGKVTAWAEVDPG